MLTKWRTQMLRTRQLCRRWLGVLFCAAADDQQDKMKECFLSMPQIQDFVANCCKLWGSCFVPVMGPNFSPWLWNYNPTSEVRSEICQSCGREAILLVADLDFQLPESVTDQPGAMFFVFMGKYLLCQNCKIWLIQWSLNQRGYVCMVIHSGVLTGKPWSPHCEILTAAHRL